MTMVAADAKEGYRTPFTFTFSAQLISDLLESREGLSDKESFSPEADALDQVLTTVTIPGELQPQVMRRLGVLLRHPYGNEDLAGIAALVSNLTEKEQFSSQQVRALIAGERITRPDGW